MIIFLSFYDINLNDNIKMQNQKIYKFCFNAFLHSVSLALKFPCVVSVTWKRGEKSAEVKERRQIDKGVVNFNQQLELECNMSFDGTTRKFQQKKTRFTVLIFSEKGNKQAGELNFDVAQILNAKQKELKVEKLLQKCPDKSAKINFTLTAYLKEEVQPDAISQKSLNSQTPEASMISPSVIQQQPDFKKKKDNSISSPKIETKKEEEQQKSKTEQRIPIVNKANKQRFKLQQQNRKLKQELNEIRELQIQSNALRRRYEQAQKKAQSYYSKKLEQVKKEYDECKGKAKTVERLIQKKNDLQKQMCDCKQKMGRILNFAILSGDNQMTEEIYNIYQNFKP